MATPTLGLDETLKRLLDQQDQMLKNLPREPPQKDMWDKLGALTGVLVAIVGGVFSFLYSSHQAKLDSMNQAHQDKIQEIQTVGTFMPYLVGNDDGARSLALSEVGSILSAKVAIKIVDQLNSVKKPTANSVPDQVFVNYLQHVVAEGKTEEDKALAKKVLENVRAGPVSH